jgi:translation elongation factor EF-Tu-like GTPase
MFFISGFENGKRQKEIKPHATARSATVDHGKTTLTAAITTVLAGSRSAAKPKAPTKLMRH